MTYIYQLDAFSRILVAGNHFYPQDSSDGIQWFFNWNKEGNVIFMFSLYEAMQYSYFSTESYF